MLCIPVVFKDVAWDKAPHWGKRENQRGKKKKKKPANEASQGVVWGGKRVAEALLHLPPPQATSRLASLADIFPRRPRFLPFSSTAEPGPRLRKTLVIQLLYTQ